MNNLVEKMLETWFTFNDGNVEDQHARMTAAAKVLLEAALGEPTNEERVQACNDWHAFDKTANSGSDNYHHCMEQLILRRKARLLAPKTLEERITVVPTNIDNYSNVLLDGKNVGPGSMRNDYAQTFAKGLIAEMKEKG